MFGPSLIAIALSSVPGAESILFRTADYLESQMLRFGVWKYSPRMGGGFPPDVDDTAMATMALRLASRPFPRNTHVFLANRNAAGLFYTWISPRLRWLRDPRMWLIAAARWRHPFVHYRALRIASARHSDVDAVVNTNVLFHLGRQPATEPVIALLVRLLNEGTELQSDRWYSNPFVIWYFFSRALRIAGIDEQTRLAARVRSASPRSALDHALAISVLIDCNEPCDDLIAELLRTQRLDGSWECAAVYTDDPLAWGSASLTTAFAVEALSRRLSRPRAETD